METVDVIIIGSGQGGTALAGALAERGQRVALFERNELGGSCVNVGCTPSKALLGAAHAAAWARRASDLGVDVEVTPDVPRILRRVREIRDTWREGVRAVERPAGVDVIHAEAAFAGPTTVRGGDRTVRADRIVINTGTSPRVPMLPGIDGLPFLTNETVFDLDELPAVIAVLGAGAIGCELGQAFARLGSEVHLIDMASRPLGDEPRRVGELLAQAFTDDGMTLHMSSEVQHVEHDGKAFRLHLDKDRTLTASAFLVAAGRIPNTRTLNAATGNIELDEDGYIVVDEHLETATRGIFAIGECARQPAFTHVSWEDHLRLLDHWDGGTRTRDDRTLAYATFTDPQVGRVGLTAEQARAAGYDVVVRDKDLSKVARAVEWGHPRGWLQMVADGADGRLLGATVVAWEGAELVQSLLPTIEAGLDWKALARAVGIHPTYVEAIRSTAREFGDAA